MFGLEQYFVVFLGILIHLIMKYTKEKKDKTFSLWFHDHKWYTLMTMIIAVALVFVCKDFLQFELLPSGWRNLVALSIGYNTDSMFKNLMKKEIATKI